MDVSVAEQTLSFTVEDTGGFQVFKVRDIGTIRLTMSGQFTLVVRPKTKARNAVMDLRSVRLIPAVD